MGRYLEKMILEIDGRPNATEQEIRDTLMRHILRIANEKDMFDGIEVTHYKNVPITNT